MSDFSLAKSRLAVYFNIPGGLRMWVQADKNGTKDPKLEAAITAARTEFCRIWFDKSPKDKPTHATTPSSSGNQ